MKVDWNKPWLSEEGELGKLLSPFKRIFGKRKRRSTTQKLRLKRRRSTRRA